MSDNAPKRRIRAQSSPGDGNVMAFVLDIPVQAGRSARFDTPDDGAPLSRTLFSIAGVRSVEASDATIWVRKEDRTDWAVLKPAIATAIRRVLDETLTPLGSEGSNPDADLLHAVEDLLKRQVNPSVASHGGHIAADRVEDGIVYLRMSGGCQGCASSSATLREGVEQMLRAALPSIREIVDVTDHTAGSTPFYTREQGSSPVFNRPVPPSVIGWDEGRITVDPTYLAPRLGLTPEALQKGLRTGEVVGVTETGEGEDAGMSRIVLRSGTRAWAAEVLTDGSSREIPPPRATNAAANHEQDLVAKIRAYLTEISDETALPTYGKLARALGHWAPGSIGRITRAIEITMCEDAAAGRPFIAARTASRGRNGLPGQGFFDLARTLSCGPEEGESDQDFHAREIARIRQTHSAQGIPGESRELIA
jgi:Fe-S cluster biogenesis protein NfuA